MNSIAIIVKERSFTNFNTLFFLKRYQRKHTNKQTKLMCLSKKFKLIHCPRVVFYSYGYQKTSDEFTSIGSYMVCYTMIPRFQVFQKTMKTIGGQEFYLV